ncbi:MAG: carboxypeptidase regulatory-like domain-containing protein [Acidobacteria bacterium]|nr:carboxypeptidase regulatory-like domain-containing protein [Acidobacteriota bacterium]
MGAVIPDTKVVLTGEKGIRLETVSDQDGAYQITVAPGTYSITARYLKHRGWEDFRLEKFELSGASENRLDITLRVDAEFSRKAAEPIVGEKRSADGSDSQAFAILTGTVYDAAGARIVRAVVTAVNPKGETFTAETDDYGVYSLRLPFNPNYQSFGFRISRYDLIVEAEKQGFEKRIVRDIRLVSGKMFFDAALDVPDPEPCGYGGAGCLPPVKDLELGPTKLSDKIQKQPLKKTKRRKSIKGQ